MAEPTCVLCAKYIRPTDPKTTVRDVDYHVACWDRTMDRLAAARETR